MTKTIRLNDLQLVLLASAAARENASLIPLPAKCTQDTARIGKAVASLLSRSLVEEKPVTDEALVWRSEDDTMIGLFITQAGREAITASDLTASTVNSAVEEQEKPAARSGSKIGQVLSLLRRDNGATLEEMIEATGWLPHTTRAALTGLKKKGHIIAKGSRDNITCYCIAAEA